MRNEEKPTRRAGGLHGDQREEHPAFGLIGASRVTSSPGARLFGSDFAHGHYIVISIRRGALVRSLGRDRFSSTGESELVQVALSESQWATFLSTLNVGEGVPCTLRTVGGESVPAIASTTDRREQLEGEVSTKLAESLAAIRELRDEAPTKRLREKADRALRELEANLPFVVAQFDEHAERTIERAKVEVAAYAQAALMRAGVSALEAGAPPISLASGSGEQSD